jgi:hypothetical protein
MLLYFNGRITDPGALLGWATAREVNNRHFQIERGQNRNAGAGIGFESIATVTSQAPDGNSLAQLTYTFTDAQPRPGINYYRLMQTNRDGTRTQVGNIVALSRKSAVPVLYPNPVSASGEASLEPAISYQHYEVHDVLGRVVQQSNTPGVLNGVSLSGLPAGMYVLRIETTDGVQTFRVLR